MIEKSWSNMPTLNIFYNPCGDISPRICLGIASCQNHVCFTEQRAAQAEWEFPAAWKNFGRKRRWRCVVFNQYKYIFPHWKTGCGASLDSPDSDDPTLAACLILCVPLGAGEKRRNPAAHYIMYTARVCVWPLCNGKFISISSLYYF